MDTAAMPLMAKMLMALFSVVVPSKMWFAPGQPITVKTDRAATLVMTTFDGQAVPAKGSADVSAGATTDLKAVFPTLGTAGTYVLFADPVGKTAPADFVGTPIVVEVLANKELGAAGGGPMITKLEPLQYVQMKTTAGPMVMTMYYDTSPNTVDSFLRLCGEGYYDGLTFHRVIKGFMLQGGDPTGTGGGGPGYSINQEFNPKPHKEGVLSMARTSDPNSAGSQFFVCLDYAQTQQLDNQYTTFGKVVDGMATANAIGVTPTGAGDKPITPQVIDHAEVVPVTPGHNPYVWVGLGK
jgi:peptidyl-prolyl cis-trans isomerase B (cyclophilin B)